MVHLLIPRPDDGAVEIIRGTHFDRQHEAAHDMGLCHHPVADTLAVEHGEIETVEHTPLIGIKT